MKRFFALLFCTLALSGLLSGCVTLSQGQIRRPQVESQELAFQTPSADAPVAIFKTSQGEFRAVLYPEIAPMAVENFTQLAKQGYYDSTNFHRIISGFAVQGGDGTDTGKGGSTIWNNAPYPMEVSDQLHHYAGALCAAFSPDEPISGMSQFYVVQALPDSVDSNLQKQMEEAGYRSEVIAAYDKAGGLPYLDYTDTVFGQVYAGMDTIDAIASTKLDEEGNPIQPVTIESVIITTYGEAESGTASDASSASSSEPSAPSGEASRSVAQSDSTSQP